MPTLQRRPTQDWICHVGFVVKARVLPHKAQLVQPYEAGTAGAVCGQCSYSRTKHNWHYHKHKSHFFEKQELPARGQTQYSVQSQCDGRLSTEGWCGEEQCAPSHNHQGTRPSSTLAPRGLRGDPRKGHGLDRTTCSGGPCRVPRSPPFPCTAKHVLNPSPRINVNACLQPLSTHLCECMSSTPLHALMRMHVLNPSPCTSVNACE